MNVENLDIESLLFDIENPRFEPKNNQREVMETIAKEHGNKVVNLAEHIAKNGLNPSETLIVIKSQDPGKYVILEGNRRFAALKFALEPTILEDMAVPKSFISKFKKINQKYGAKLTTQVDCHVAESRNLAKVWIELRHTGENNGIGIMNWNGVATQRFRGSSPELVLLAMVKDSDYLDSNTRDKLSKIPITNIQRLIGTPEVRKKLGVEIKNKNLCIVGQKDKVVPRLAIIVNDVANKYLKVSDIDGKDQRIEYAKKVISRPLPKPNSKISPTIERSKKTGQQLSGLGKKRKVLVPKNVKLKVTPNRIRQILIELQKLPIDKFVNSCSVLLRVFLEMSIEEYADKNSIVLKKKSKQGQNTRPMKLKEKIREVTDHMIKNKICDKYELQGIITLANTKDQIFSIDSWHGYVHNRYFSPLKKDLIDNWDNIEIFFKKLWP